MRYPYDVTGVLWGICVSKHFSTIYSYGMSYSFVKMQWLMRWVLS